MKSYIGIVITDLGVLSLPPRSFPADAPRTFEIIADKDNTFKVVGQKKPIITVKAGEVIRLKFTALKRTEFEKDGSVHSFTIKRLKDQGWDLRLKEGTKEFTLVAPSDPGEYVVECAVKCGSGHNAMKMKMIVIR